MVNNKGILKWIQKNQVRTNKGIPIEFRDHGFLLGYVTDTHNRIVVRKCTQVGASFSTLVKLLHLGDQAPITSIYVLPTSSEAKNFVLSKFDPMIERSPGLLAMVQKIVLRNQVLYNTVVKRIGESYFFFRGAWNSHTAQSIDADAIVIDELDFQKPEIRSMWEERTEGSASLNTIYWIGYPSIPNFGIEELYENSDKRMWFIQCPHCKKRQVLEFPDNIDMEKEIYVCKFCKGELSDDDRRKGIWKITNPGSDIHGYWINKLMAPWISASRIIERFKKDAPKKFYNYTLGLPYISKETDLTDDIIQNAMVEEKELAVIKAGEDTKILCGIDQGDIFHMLIAIATQRSLVVIAAEQLRSEEEVMRRLNYYKPDLVIMDMFPNRHTAKNLCKNYGSTKLYMAKERNWSQTAKQRTYWNLNRATSEVGIERTESIDAMMEYIMKGVVRFRRVIPRLLTLDKKDPGVIQQLKNLVPDTQERHGVMRRVYKAVGPEHYGHSLNFIVTAAHLAFPGWMCKEGLIPSSYLDELKNLKKPKPWYIKDFEKRTRGLNPNDTIIIKPGGEIIEPEGDWLTPRAC